ncbi:unnamed protein product [Prunus armeniaca]
MNVTVHTQKFQNSSPSPLLLFIRPVFGLPSPPLATPSDDMGIKRTSTLSSTSRTSQPLPTAVWIAGKSMKLAGFYPKSPSLIRAIPSTICFNPAMNSNKWERLLFWNFGGMNNNVRNGTSKKLMEQVT